jgi:hypothetical protein
MPSAGFEPMIPAFERAKTVHGLDRAATVIGKTLVTSILNSKAASKPVTTISDEDRLKRNKISVVQLLGAGSSKKKPFYNLFMPISKQVPKRRNFLLVISLLDK